MDKVRKQVVFWLAETVLTMVQMQKKNESLLPRKSWETTLLRLVKSFEKFSLTIRKKGNKVRGRGEDIIIK